MHSAPLMICALIQSDKRKTQLSADSSPVSLQPRSVWLAVAPSSCPQMSAQQAAVALVSVKNTEMMGRGGEIKPGGETSVLS